MTSLPITLLTAIALSLPAAAMPPSAPSLSSDARPQVPVIIDPGHGGDDLGAVVHGLREKDIALAVARKLRDRLKADVPVRMTRDSDDYVPLDRRVVDAVDWDGALFVSIHLNQVRSRKNSGAIVYSFAAQKVRRHWHFHRRHPKVPLMPAPPRVESRQSDELAGAVVAELRRDGFRVEQSRSDYYVLKNPTQPSILIELGYLSNPDEAAKLSDPAYQDKIADSLAKALSSFAENRAIRTADSAASPAPAAQTPTAPAAPAPL
jgi:N-acetylmuramoyl-L-alanine amidase